MICIIPLSFAATQNELHDFSPDKEPLMSMLEGEIQAMYMCKPGEWGLAVHVCNVHRFAVHSACLCLCVYILNVSSATL